MYFRKIRKLVSQKNRLSKEFPAAAVWFEEPFWMVWIKFSTQEYKGMPPLKQTGDRIMKNNNTLGFTSFLLWHLFWIIIGLLLYKAYLFQMIPAVSYGGSLLLLVGSVMVCSLIGIVWQRQKHRNFLSILINLSSGFGLYYAISCWRNSGTLILACLILAVVLSLILFAAAGKKRASIGSSKKTGSQPKRVVSVFLPAVSAGLVLAMSISTAASIVREFQGGYQAVPVAQKDIRNETINDHMKLLSRLYPTEWIDLSGAERLEALQAAADVEQIHLGIPHQLTVVTADLSDDILGQYTESSRTVTVNNKAISENEPKKLLKIICHEAYHAYQYRLVDALETADEETRKLKPFRDALRYAWEFQDYIGADGDDEQYASQSCEEDARDYAEEECEVYWYCIKKHLHISE